MRSQLSEYAPVLLLLLAAVVVTGGMLGMSVLLGKVGRRSPAKDSAWECGMTPVEGVTSRFAVRFHVVAMLFILFDIEVVLLYPWAVEYRRMLSDSSAANLAFFGMLVFLAILWVGYIYAWKKRAFDWTK